MDWLCKVNFTAEWVTQSSINIYYNIKNLHKFYEVRVYITVEIMKCEYFLHQNQQSGNTFYIDFFSFTAEWVTQSSINMYLNCFKNKLL